MDQWEEWLTRPSTEDEVPNIDWLITVFNRTKMDDGNPYPGIKSWAQTVCYLKELCISVLSILLSRMA